MIVFVFCKNQFFNDISKVTKINLSFESLLQASHIGTISPYINSTMPHDIIDKVPPPESIIHIDSEEHFPLSPPKKIGDLPIEEMEEYFTQMQMKLLFLKQSFGGHPSNPTISASILQIPGEFNSVEDFIQFKRELATVYKARSLSYGWKQIVTVCHEPFCLNSTPPGFIYCCSHVHQDPHYKDQIFIKECSEILEDQNCPIPCGSGFPQCALHAFIKQNNPQ